MTTTQPVDTEWFRTPVPLRRNRLHHFAGRVHEVLDEIGEVPTWAMSAPERGETLAELVALQARTQARILALVADADRADDAGVAGATHTAAYLASATGITGTEASRLVRTARAIEPHQDTLAALAEGVIHPEQSAAIVAAVDALPDEVADQRAAAQEHLLALALEHDAQALRALGKHLLEVVAPDQADALLARKLEREEAQARKTTHVKTWSDGHGSRHIRAKVPDLHGDILDAILQAYANPDRPHPIPRDGAASPQVHGQALCQMLEHYPLDNLPQAGGVTATVVVTMTLDTLMGGLQAASVLGTDTLLSPGQARRLAAAAAVIPAVLGGQSQLLDLGRRRSFTQTQRIAMAIRQGGRCNIADCQRPASWCDANHRRPYSHGGRTTLDNGELVCPRHHALVHQGHHYPRRT